MQLRHWLAVWLLGALSAPSCIAMAKEPAPRQYELSTVGEIEINPDGSVRDYKLVTKLPPLVAEPVDRSVRRWRFEPVLVDGHPVIAKTRMRLSLSLEPVGDGYQLRISDVGFGDPQRREGTFRPPTYPRDAAIAGIGAQVILILKLDAGGNVLAAHPYQSSLDRRASDKTAAKWRQRFEQASLGVAMGWKFDMTETVDGRFADTLVRMPVEFLPPLPEGAPRHDNRWHAYVPGSIVPPPWSEIGTGMATMDEAQDNDPRSMSSHFRLKEDVVGKLL